METRCTNDPLRNEKRRFRLIWLMAGFLAMRTPPQERIELRYAGNFEGLGLLPQEGGYQPPVGFPAVGEQPCGCKPCARHGQCHCKPVLEIG